MRVRRVAVVWANHVIACSGVALALSNGAGSCLIPAAFNHISCTLWIWAKIETMSRPLPSGVAARQAAGSRFSIRYEVIRLLMSKARRIESLGLEADEGEAATLIQV